MSKACSCKYDRLLTPFGPVAQKTFLTLIRVAGGVYDFQNFEEV